MEKYTFTEMELIEEDILTQLKEGKHDAFDRVFLSYYNRVKKFINGFIKSEEDAKELTQDVFTKIWINRSNIDLNKSFNSFLFTITRNVTYNYLKHRLVHESYVKDYLTITEHFDNNVEELFFAKEINLLIDMAVGNMPPRRRSIFIYSKLEGYSNAEIAEKMKISKKTVENQLSLALKEIREVIYLFLLLFHNSF